MKMTRFKYHFIFCLLASLLILSGCGGDSRQRELQRYITELKAKAAQKEVKGNANPWQLPTALTYHPGGYSGSEMRAGSANGVTNPVQAYPLKALQFVGTLSEGNQLSAYIMTPDSMIYLVKVGDVIGEEYGKIVKIDSDHLEITEKEMTGNQPSERIVTLELKDSP